MTFRWWSLPTKELDLYCDQIAKFHTSPINGNKDEDQEALKHRMQHKRDLNRTAKDLKKLEKISELDACTTFLNAAFNRPYASRSAIMISAYIKPKRMEQLPISEIRKRAEQCRRLHSLKEPIEYCPIPKGDGTMRDTWAFGPVRFAQQILLSWLLTASGRTPKHDFSYPGHNGINGAAKKISSALVNDYRFWITTDIKSAFPSVTREHFRNVFPQVTKRLERYIAFPNLPHSKTTTCQLARRELPQGAAHSSLVLSAVIDGCLAEITLGNVMVVVFADNLAIGAQTKSEVKHAYFAIKEAFSDLPSGLMFHKTFLCDAFQHADCISPTFIDGFKFVSSVDFCGYRISKDIATSEIRIRPSAKAWKKFWLRFGQEHFSESWTMEKLQEEAIWSVLRWRSGLSLWKPDAPAIEMIRTNAIEKFGDLLSNPYKN